MARNRQQVVGRVGRPKYRDGAQERRETVPPGKVGGRQHAARPRLDKWTVSFYDDAGSGDAGTD